jgi:hypothetical protein
MEKKLPSLRLRYRQVSLYNVVSMYTPIVCFFPLYGEDSRGDHGLGSLVELRFKAPPGISYSHITIHLIGTT